MSGSVSLTTMNRLIVGVLAAALVTALGLVAAQEEAQHGGTLRVGYHNPMVNWDVMGTTGTRDEIAQMVLEPLVTFDAALEPQPFLAESWEVSEDELTWTFHLRQGVEFHDGSPLTSADVIASFDRYMDMGARRAEFERVESWEAIDDYTVAFHLSGPWAALPETFGMPSGGFVIHPEHVVEQVGSDLITAGDPDFLEVFIGTGPYRLVEAVTEERFRFERYENYQQPPGEASGWAGPRGQYSDEIIVLPIPDDATRAASLFAGEVDLADQLPPEDFERLEQDPNTQASLIVPGRKVYLKLNSEHGPFADELLRQAVRTAIDPEEVMFTQGPPDVWRDNTVLRYQEGQWMWDESITRPYYEVDLERARELVEQSGYDGEPIRYMITPGVPDMFRAAPLVLEVLQDIGLNATIETFDEPTFRERRTDLTAWEIKGATGGSVVPLAYLDASSRDRTGERWSWVPPEWDEQLDIIATELDEERRQEAVNELNRIVIETAAELWMGEVFPVVGARQHLNDVPDFHYMRLFDVWQDQ